jgi:hypothetical protein
MRAIGRIPNAAVFAAMRHELVAGTIDGQV